MIALLAAARAIHFAATATVMGARFFSTSLPNQRFDATAIGRFARRAGP